MDRGRKMLVGNPPPDGLPLIIKVIKEQVLVEILGSPES